MSEDQEKNRIWSGAVRLVLPQGRYAALLVSLHGTGLYERYHAATDPHYAPYATEEVVARNRRLVQVWDALSLAIC